jgi:AraC-like DNA-binding protein
LWTPSHAPMASSDRGESRSSGTRRRTSGGRSHAGSARFREYVGVRPEDCRSGDPVRPCRRAAARGTDVLAEVGAECGKSDQAHLTRDFHELAGAAPTTCSPRRAPSNFLQDEAPARALRSLQRRKERRTSFRRSSRP